MEPQSARELITETLQHSGHNVPWAVRTDMVIKALEAEGYKIIRFVKSERPPIQFDPT